MRRNFVVGVLAALLLAVTMTFVAHAQNPNASVQWNPQILVGPAITQNFSTAGSTPAITITPPGGSCTYIWEIDSSPSNGTNTVVTNGFFTLTAGSFIRKWTVGVGATAQSMGTGFVYAPSMPVKTAATTITLGGPTGLANTTWNVGIDYSFGPC